MLDDKIKANFKGKIVQKEKTRLPDLQHFPRFVVEYLTDSYCHEESFEEDLMKVKQKLSKHYITPADAERIKHTIKQKGEYSLIGKLSVRLSTEEDKYWATIQALNENCIHIDENLINTYPRILGGLWGVIDIGYDASLVWKKKVRPFTIRKFAPFQVAQVDLDDYISKRKEFSTEEWIELIIRTIGLNPAKYNKRERLLMIARLIPLVEKFCHIMELGPRETGKSYVHKNISYYTYLLSGGKATRSSLFVHLGTGKPGVVAQFDSVVFDEIASTIFTEPETTVSIFKDYMEYGYFSLGKHTITGEASIIMVGNIDVTGKMPHSKYPHLFYVLPVELQDAAFIDRIYGYIPGWEMDKMSSDKYAMGYGLVMDYFAEIVHTLKLYQLPFSYASKFKLYNATGRDERRIYSIVNGFMKILHPEGNFTDDELKDYLDIAVELRQRIKDQLKIIAPGEFQAKDIVYELSGQKYSPKLAERERKLLITIPEKPDVGRVVGLSVSETMAGILQIIEAIATKGTGDLIMLGNMDSAMKESLKSAFECLNNSKEKYEIDADFKDGYDISIMALNMDVPKEGASAGLPFFIALYSAITKKKIDNKLAFTGEVTLKGDLLAVSGIDLKIKAAKDAGCGTVIMPKANKNDVDQLPKELTDNLDIKYVSNIDEALREAKCER